MIIFPKANLMSLSRRRLIYGVGINDSKTVTRVCIEGKHYEDPLYLQWKAMLQRCYCLKWKKTYPTYEECTVETAWLRFSNFVSWAKKYKWKHQNLDKDLLVPGNKHYGPNTCLWVDPNINRLLLNSKKRKGNYPVGVSKIKNSYMARISKNSICETIGCYKTINEAAQAFLIAKADHVLKIAEQQKSPLRQVLIKISNLIRQGSYYD